jgi:enoyl-CoA hydratase
MAFAASLAAKPNAVLRAAKASLNQIDPVDVKRSYRAEQGFTYELNLAGEGDRARDAFVKDGA